MSIQDKNGLESKLQILRGGNFGYYSKGNTIAYTENSHWVTENETLILFSFLLNLVSSKSCDLCNQYLFSHTEYFSRMHFEI